MKKVLILFFSLCSCIVFSQSNYEKGMQKAMQEWQSGHTKEAIAVLERVADADKENWIPVYYNVFVGITQGFRAPQEEGIEERIAYNRLLIEQWIQKNQAIDEWYVLKGMNETLELMTDPISKGMTQGSIITKAYEQALTINPNNPRAVYSLANFNLNSAKFIKVDIPANLVLIKQSITLFDQQKKDIPFYPAWGREMAIQTQEAYSSKEDN